MANEVVNPDFTDIMTQIKKANPQWPDQLRTVLHDIQYDSGADILYVAYGTPGASYSVPIGGSEEGIYLRVEISTDIITGFDIMDFKSNFLATNEEAREVFEPFFAFMGLMDWRIQVKPSEPEQLALYVPAQASLEYFDSYIPTVAPELMAV